MATTPLTLNLVAAETVTSPEKTLLLPKAAAQFRKEITERDSLRLPIRTTAAQLHAALGFSWLSHAIVCTQIAQDHCSSALLKILVFVLLVCLSFFDAAASALQVTQL